jgi:hypothetical protein
MADFSRLVQVYCFDGGARTCVNDGLVQKRIALVNFLVRNSLSETPGPASRNLSSSPGIGHAIF